MFETVQTMLGETKMTLPSSEFVPPFGLALYGDLCAQVMLLQPNNSSMVEGLQYLRDENTTLRKEMGQHLEAIFRTDKTHSNTEATARFKKDVAEFWRKVSDWASRRQRYVVDILDERSLELNGLTSRGSTISEKERYVSYQPSCSPKTMSLQAGKYACLTLMILNARD